MHIYLIEINLRPRTDISTAYGEYYEQSDICAFRAGNGIGIRSIKSRQASRDLWLQLAALFRPFQIPDSRFQILWLSGRAHINMQLFCIFRSCARFLFSFSFLFICRWRLLRRCGLTHISPCLWHSRLSGGDSKLTFTQRCGCTHISLCDIFICWFIYLFLFICIICIWHIFTVPLRMAKRNQNTLFGMEMF